jgi:hypothetical protein
MPAEISDYEDEDDQSPADIFAEKIGD